VSGRDTGSVKLDGWNFVPRGYGLGWEAAKLPLLLRVLIRTPFIDRFAYPMMVRQGLAWLKPHPGWEEADRAPVPPGWRVDRSGA